MTKPIIQPITQRPLRRTHKTEEYDLYKAALEWDLVEPIVIDGREDLRSEKSWKEMVEPYQHQVTNLITFCRRLPVTLLADDVGLGKTVSAGLIVSELAARGRLSRILIVCPKLLMPQWKEELETKFAIKGTIATGRDLASIDGQDESGGQQDFTGAIITTYQSARMYFDAVSRAGFDMLVLDEAHKLRNLYGVENPPVVARRFYQALSERQFKYVLMLTATPIQNRLWDLYSLVDLLTVARGHQNPFGTEGNFARRFIADGRNSARQLREDRKDEFRSIVYGYMSRFRRADAKLYFPERMVEMERVNPTSDEKQLLTIVSKGIEPLTRLAQISILQALVSSPQALSKQLDGMAQKRTAPEELAAAVRAVVERMGPTSKLQGLAALIQRLRAERPEDWRVVIFTTRRETQSIIQDYLIEQGITCGLINGDSGQRNQDTITRFRTKPPELHVIISTEAGSEGVNLQAANVLVNYDLPWNPMVVEQRIGRIQRLASEHASVCVFNIILKGTFEEYIVGRLMQKLQMASHAIGDVESLLEAAGMDDDEDGKASFAEKIRALVMSSLKGKDVEHAARLAEESISKAKAELEREEKNINSLLSGMDGGSGPKCPDLPPPYRSMDEKTFIRAAVQALGGELKEKSDGLYEMHLDAKRELVRFEVDEVPGSPASILYAAGAPAFERMVSRFTGEARHRLEEHASETSATSLLLAREWARGMAANVESVTAKEEWRAFSGKVLLGVRITVAHDSYERLIEMECSPADSRCSVPVGQKPLGTEVKDTSEIGLTNERLIEAATKDPGVAEFCRFYMERLEAEIVAAGDNSRKRKKLEDDFTPRIEISVVGMEGEIFRDVRLNVSYQLEGYQGMSSLLVRPARTEILEKPEVDTCAVTQRKVPIDALEKCAISGKRAIKSLLLKSEFSGRVALPDYFNKCAATGKRALPDELDISVLTGKHVASAYMKTSLVSGKKAEPEFFSRCDFTHIDALEPELMTSQVSGKRYRADQSLQSAVSGKAGHQSEFVHCAETNHALLPTEGEHCEATGRLVMPGLLEVCEVSGKRVVPRELERCAATGKKVLKKFLVQSSISGALILESEAIRSSAGRFCTKAEGKSCAWSNVRSHPDDLRTCLLTGLLVRTEHMQEKPQLRLGVLAELLDGVNRKTDGQKFWPQIAKSASPLVGGGKCTVEAAALSADGGRLVACIQVRTWLIKVRHAGVFFSVKDRAIIGKVRTGRRDGNAWHPEV